MKWQSVNLYLILPNMFVNSEHLATGLRADRVFKKRPFSGGRADMRPVFAHHYFEEFIEHNYITRTR